MPTLNNVPNAISSANAPSFGPTGNAFSVVGVTQSDLIAGVNVYADPQTGGQQTVRAIADFHYRHHDEQFFVATEESCYGYLQIDPNGAGLNGRPVYSVTIGDVIDEIAAEILCGAFADRDINIEYAIARRTRDMYSPELRLLSNGLITAGAANFTTIIDNTDSTLMRKRHGGSYDSAMISAMADLITRQHPVQGFLTSGTGPGNAIIEALRRCGITIAKKLTTNDRALGVATITTRDIIDHLEKGYSHRNVALPHAWKYDRNQAGNLTPDLLDIEVGSAILDLDRHKHQIKDAKVVRKLREKIKDEQRKDAEKKEKNASMLLPMRRAKIVDQPVVEPVTSAAIAAGPAPRVPRNARGTFEGGSLTTAVERTGAAQPALLVQVVTAIVEHDLEVGERPEGRNAEALAAYAMTAPVVQLMQKVGSTIQRMQVSSASAITYAHVMFAQAAPEKADAFFKGLSSKSKERTVQTMLIKRLHGLTKTERTPLRVLDYMLQAWAAHIAGTPIIAFVDNHELPPVAGMVDGNNANDNAAVDDLDKAA